MKSIVGAGLSCLLTATSLFAQSDSTRKQSPRKLDPVVVRDSAGRGAGYGATTSRAASKSDVPLQDTPQSVSVITRGLIADQRMQGIADIARYVPGVAINQGEGHRDQPV